jgi:hypothetical protein
LNSSIPTRYLAEEKKIDKEQASVDEEIGHFQQEKQRKLNEIQTAITLRLSQVQCLEDKETDCKDI